MVSLRQRKRGASPADEAQPQPPKKQVDRGKTKAKSEPISDGGEASDDNKPRKQQQKRKTKAKTDPNGGNTTANGKGKGKAQAADDDETATSEVADAQFAKSGQLNIPLDEGCYLSAYNVYIDHENGMIYDASLNQTNAGKNNNKFYRIQLLTDNKGDYRVWTRWGRVGEVGKSATAVAGSLDAAVGLFDKKFKDKSGLKWADRGSEPRPGKYVFIERSYEPESDDEKPAHSAPKERARSHSPAKCTLEPAVQSLMELIFNQQYFASTMADLNYDANKLPLGKLSKATITRGYEALKNLAALLDDPSLAASKHNASWPVATEQLSNLYYSFIPHAFGRNRPPVIQSQTQLKREVELLESLTDLKDADSILKAEKGDTGSVHALDALFNGLELQEMTPIAQKSDEFYGISEYLLKTRGATHAVSYELIDVFRIERKGELERFQKDFVNVSSDRRLLWHGSRSTNYGGILSQGLRIAPPEAPVSGYMFGKGIYLADMSSKSANYCCSHISGGHALLLLCEAELGNPMQTLTCASYTAGEDARAKNMYSTWGQGLNGPKEWKDAKCIHSTLAGVMMPDTSLEPGETNVSGASILYNEYICYDLAQVRLRYLLRVKM